MELGERHGEGCTSVLAALSQRERETIVLTICGSRTQTLNCDQMDTAIYAVLILISTKEATYENY